MRLPGVSLNIYIPPVRERAIGGVELSLRCDDPSQVDAK